jgi:uncharacterized membrane protein
MIQFAIGLVAATLIGFAGYRAKALTLGGAIAAFGVGSITYGSGGVPFACVLLFFFVSAVILGRVGRARKKTVIDIGKTGARDAWQVIANGGVATLCAGVSGVLYFCNGLSPIGHSGWTEYPPLSIPFNHSAFWLLQPDVWMVAFCGAYAAATADTWGTEIGMLAKQLPRSILTFRPVATGLSGGITAAGTLGEIVGALFVGIVAIAAFVFEYGPPGLRLGPDRIAIAVVAGGIAGALVDSVLGATFQELRHCPNCNRSCETDPHACGSPTSLIRGAGWFSNDLVNFAATAAGAGTAFIIAAV